MDTHQRRQHWWLLPLVGAVSPIVTIMTFESMMSLEIAVAIVTMDILIFGAMAIWMRANHESKGTEWWQDDECSGWRGY